MKCIVGDMKVKRMVLAAFYMVLIFVQEQAIWFLPNIQFTFMLILLGCQMFTLPEMLLIVSGYVLLDNMIMGSMNIFIVLPMYIGYVVYVLLIKLVFKKTKNVYYLGLVGVLGALIYSWMFIIPTSMLFGISIKAYLIADIVFEALLAGSTFLSIIWVYPLMYDLCKKNNYLLIKEGVEDEG